MHIGTWIHVSGSYCWLVFPKGCGTTWSMRICIWKYSRQAPHCIRDCRWISGSTQHRATASVAGLSNQGRRSMLRQQVWESQNHGYIRYKEMRAGLKKLSCWQLSVVCYSPSSGRRNVISRPVLLSKWWHRAAPFRCMNRELLMLIRLFIVRLELKGW